MSEYKKYVEDRASMMDIQKAVIEEALEEKHTEELGALIEEIYNEDLEVIDNV